MLILINIVLKYPNVLFLTKYTRLYIYRKFINSLDGTDTKIANIINNERIIYIFL